MKCLIVAVLLSVLATVIAAPKISTAVTASPEVNFFDKFFDNKDFGAVLADFLKDAAEDICENNTDLMIPFNEVIKRATELEKNDLESMTVCTLLKTKFIYVTEPMVTTIDGCVSDDLAGIANFIVNAVVSGFNTICDYSMEEYFELFNPCAVNADYIKCIEDVQRRWDEIESENSKKTFQQQFCSAFTGYKPCMEEATNKNCKLEITQRAISRIMDSILDKPCAI